MSVDLTNWTVQAYAGTGGIANWQIAADGLSILQTQNSAPSLFCSDFDTSGSSLEGEIYVDTSFDDDFIGFALGYSIGDNIDADANWYLIDWKQGTQSFTWGSCGTTTGVAGFAISEVTGIPYEAEFWAHSDLSCNQFGGLREIERGINFGAVGWTDRTTYQFRFEVSSTHILAYVNNQLELNVTGSFDKSGKFCYYNFSQERVRYSGLTRQTPSPSSAPSMPTDTTPPVCEVVGVTEDGVVMARASDAESGILSLSFDPPSADLVLMSDFVPGEFVVDFNVSIINDSDLTDYRDTTVVAENTAGSTCVFPTIGSILDDDCSNDAECQPDLALEFPFPTSTPAVPAFDFSSVTVLVQPSFADIDFNETSLLYVPRWVGIQYDAFALEGKTVYGDTFILSVEYFGSNQMVDIQIDIVGQWLDYIWFDEDYDEEGIRRLADRRPALPIEWHHEIPVAVFVDGADVISIDGIDRALIDSPEFGVILRRGDHRGTGNPISTQEYNQVWRDWVDNFRNNNGRLPTKDEIVNIGLEEIRKDPRVAELNSRGIRNHDIKYSDWNKSGNRQFKERSLAKLDDAARVGAKTKALAKSRFARKLATKASKVIPVVGSVVAAGIFLNDILVEGRPIGEAILDNGQDLIPVWGELRAAYSLLDELGIFDALGLKVDADSLESLVWDAILDFFGLVDVNDRNSDGVAEAYPDPHFRTWNGQRYDYHGACDMIYIRNSLVEMHIRTEKRGSWSTIVGVALRIGNDVLEIDKDGYYINAVMPSLPPETVGGGYPFSWSRPQARIELSGGQFIAVAAHLVRISAHGSEFYDSNGMCGKWDRRELVGRDGVTTFEDPAEFAKEWEVNTTLGDPQLFRTAAVSVCGESPPTVEPDQDLLELAMTACANIPKEENKEECIFDVVNTGDPTSADNEVYTNPLEPEERCVAASSDCELHGGTCVWRCDSEVSTCVPDLCDLASSVEEFGGETRRLTVVDGCSCAVPLEVLVPTEMPTLDPTSSLSPSSSAAPSQSPSLSNSLSLEPSVSLSPSEAPSLSSEPSVSVSPPGNPSLSAEPSSSASPSSEPSESVVPSESPSRTVGGKSYKGKKTLPAEAKKTGKEKGGGKRLLRGGSGIPDFY